MKQRILVFLIGVIAACTPSAAQQYLGMQGLIHVPTADMDSTGSARIGAHYVPKEFMPERMRVDGEKFNSLTNYMSFTPFSWIEIGYGYTLWKFHRNRDPQQKVGFYAKDRYFSVIVRPLKEGKYWPAVAIGGNDVWGSGDDGYSGSNFYRNYYLAMSKHVDLADQTIGVHLAYRKWKNEDNQKWNGVVGGLTFSPSFYKPLRLIGEWTGNEVNVGIDCRLMRYFLVQASLLDCRYPTAGLCLYIPLL